MTADLTKTFRESFSPLRIPNFRIYLGGQAVSLIGTWLQMTAQSWVVWELSHSELVLGIVGMLNMLPILLLSPFTGVWADRLDRRKLLIGTQVGMMILAFILAALIGLQVVQLWHVYVLATLLGVLTALDMPAQQAFLGDLSGMAEVRRAVNLNAMIIQVSRMLGPAVAGIVVSRLGASIAFWLNGLSFIAVIVSLIMVKANQMKMQSGGAKSGGFVEGLRYLATQPRLQDLFIFVGLLTFFGLSIILTMLPAFASDVLHGDAQTLGLLMGASGAGALISTLIFVPISQNLKRPALAVALCTLWAGFWFVVMSFIHWLPLDMLALFMGALGGPVIFTTALGLTQVFTPMEMRARVISVFTMISFGLQPIASLFIGWSAQTFGTPTAVLINGVLLMLGALVMLAIRGELRRWEIAPIVSAAPVEATA